MFFKYIFLNTIIIDSDEFPSINFRDINGKKFFLLSTQPICQFFTVFPLIYPFVSHKKAEKLAHLLAPVKCFPHLVCVFLVLLTHQGGYSFVYLDWNFVF